jgi:branched-chain amino acid transport system ATP-binding protein
LTTTSPNASASLADIFEKTLGASSTSPDTILDVRDLTVRFGGVLALNGITFSVRRHELVALIGPNGSGKSTTLNSISGLVSGNASGEIAIRDQTVLGRPPVAIARAGVARSFQNPSLIDSISVIENVMVGEHLRLGYSLFDQMFRRRRVRRAEREARIRALTALEFMGLSHLAEHNVAGLAYGTRKLLDIARAIVSGPDLLLLDEPTSGLDGDEQSAVGSMLQELHRATDISILVVEHHMHVVRQIADRVVALESGQVLTIGTPDEVLQSDTFRQADAVSAAEAAVDDTTTEVVDPVTSDGRTES